MAISYTVKEATRESGLSRGILYRLIAEGKLKSTTVGRRRLILARSLTELITRGVPRVEPSSERTLATLSRGRGKGGRRG